MKFDELTKGKTFYSTRVDVSKSPRQYKNRPKFDLKYFILKTDEVKKQVFASCNGQPPAWYKSYFYKYWHNKIDEQ